MKRIESFRRWTALAGVALCVALGAGCEPRSSAPGPRSTTGTPAPLAASAEKNSFHEVTARLETGGDFYLYLSTEQWLTGLSTQIEVWQKLLAEMPGLPPEQATGMHQAIEVAKRLIRRSGLEEISGLGMSGVASEKGLYHTKMLAHHYPSRNTGAMWQLFGKAPHPLVELDGLPSNTVFAAASDLDAAGLWQLLAREVGEAGIPGAEQWFKDLPTQVERMSGLKWSDALAAFGGSVGVALTLDESRTISLPLPQGVIEMPEPGLAIFLRGNNAALFDLVDRLTKDNPQVTREDKDGLRTRTVALPPFLPIPLRPTLVSRGDTLVLATTDGLAKDILSLRQSPQRGLRGTADFQRMARNIPLEGNGFTWVSPALGRTVQNSVKEFLEAQAAGGSPQVALFQQMQAGATPRSSFAVAQNTAEGWLTWGNSTQNPAVALVASGLVAPAAVAAGMVLPALAQAKDRAQTIACMNNLKQIGLAARIWATDHGDKLPPDWVSMKETMPTTRVLYCPKDPAGAAHAHDTWETLDVQTISYELVSPGAAETDPTVVFARCRFHNQVVMVDGSVQKR